MEIFEPYISTVVEVADTRPKTVWTIVDVSNSDDMHIIAGYHLVDRVFHFITNEEWQDEYEAYMWS